MSDVSLHCSGCLEEKCLVRILNCQHEFCESCCVAYFRKDSPAPTVEDNVTNSGYIVCPVEQNCTNTSLNEMNEYKNLPKKISLNLACDNCSKIYSLQNHWWCSECIETVCSFCAMKNHRNHSCNTWEDENLVKECLQIFQPFSNMLTESVDEEINGFCTRLAEELRKRLSRFEEAMSFVKAIGHVFGPNSKQIESVEIQQTPQKINKKLQLMNYIMSTIDKDFSFDTEELAILYHFESNKLFRLPSLAEIIDLFFINSTTTESNGNKVPDSLKSAQSNVEVLQQPVAFSAFMGDKMANFAHHASIKPLAGQVRESSGTKTFEGNAEKKTINVTWSLRMKYLCKNPSRICAIPNVGVVMLDDFGIHLFNQNLVSQAFKGYPVPSGQTVVPSVAFHPRHKSIIVLREVKYNKHDDAKKIIELSIPSLTRLSATPYADFHDKDNRLLGVLNCGSIICASSSLIWLKSFNPSKSSIIWRRNANQHLESFVELVVGPPSNDFSESIYFMGTTAVYVFAYNLSCRCVRTISNVFSPIIHFKNRVYASNEECIMVPLDQHQHQHDDRLKVHALNFIEKNNVLLTCDGDCFIYSLNCDSNMLLIGKFLDA